MIAGGRAGDRRVLVVAASVVEQEVGEKAGKETERKRWYWRRCRRRC